MRVLPIALTMLLTAWLLLAVAVTALDSIGLASIDRTESFPGETIPPDQLTAFDFWGGLASLFVTLPLGCLKIGALMVSVYVLHINPVALLAPFLKSDTALALANAGFDLSLFLSIPVTLTIVCLIISVVRRPSTVTA